MNTGPSPLLTTIPQLFCMGTHLLRLISAFLVRICFWPESSFQVIPSTLHHFAGFGLAPGRSLSNGQESCAHLCRASGESVCLASSQPFLNNFPALNTWLSHSGNVPDLQLLHGSCFKRKHQLNFTLLSWARRLLKLWHQLSYTCTDSP